LSESSKICACLEAVVIEAACLLLAAVFAAFVVLESL